jgi:Pyruvate/2-oxoacid:ferredoxin oxidoreductase delta subunit/siroheme synthase (precorrin-2 oxidase/ferrochelatase)
MALFKAVKKPVIRSSAGTGEVSSARPRFVPKAPPCESVCSSGENVRDWLVPIAQHQANGQTSAQAFELAWRKATEKNPFPAVCGRVCQHGCEQGCNRKGKDGAVAINAVEQFLGDFAITNGLKSTPLETVVSPGQAVAIVGAGPAGLSCAYHLARLGYRVTIFEAASQPGGMMRYRVPRQVLPADVLDAEIGNIRQLGVELRTGCVVGRDVPLEQLRRDYKAVFFALGLQKAAELEIQKADGLGILVGTVPSELPTAVQEPTEVDRKALNTISVAISQGRTVAVAIDCCLNDRVPEPKSTPQVIKADKMKLSWYPPLPRQEYPRALDGGGASSALNSRLTEAQVIEEAKRCMSCGMCMDCETCWMYCTNNAFVKLPKGEHYKIKLEVCNGCNKCAEACPCGYIDMV